MDFNAAESERLERDKGLASEYSLDVPLGTGNLYLMPSGRLVSAEDMLYNPTVILENARRVLN